MYKMKSGIGDPTLSREKWGTYGQQCTSFELEPFFPTNERRGAKIFVRSEGLFSGFASRELFFYFDHQLFLVPISWKRLIGSSTGSAHEIQTRGLYSVPDVILFFIISIIWKSSIFD